MSIYPLSYLAILIGVFVVYPVYTLARRLHNLLAPRFRVGATFLYHARPPFLPRSWEVTWRWGFFFTVHVGLNVVVLSVPIGDDKPALVNRTAVAASINLLVVLLAGRTNPWVDHAQIPLHAYHAAHRWIGAVAIAESLWHSGLVLYRRRVFDALGASGSVAAGSLLLVLVAYPWSSRQSWRFFGRLHLVLYLAATAGWTWHVLLQQGVVKIFALVACAAWLATHLYRLARIFLLNRCAVVRSCWKDGEATVLKLEVNTPVRVFPGCYFYLFFPGPLSFYNRLHGYPMMLLWSEHQGLADQRATQLFFLAAKEGHHDRALACTEKGHSLRLEGPYGKHLGLNDFETVVLAAKGLGITGILPLALHLVRRKRHDDIARNPEARRSDSAEPVFRDLTRQVDVFWWLEHGSQEDWVRDQLRALQNLQDTQNASLVVWCIFPSIRTNEDTDPLFKPDGFFFVKYNVGLDDFERELRQEARYPGRAVLLACGEEAFMSAMRNIALKNSTPDRVIDLAELEYRPHYRRRPLRQRVPGTFGSLSARIVSRNSHATATTAADIEMQDVVADIIPPTNSSIPSPTKPSRIRRTSRMV